MNIILNAKEGDSKSVAIYNEFARLCVQHIVGKHKMKEMGKNLPRKKRKSYTQVVTITDEAFAILLLEDRWTLWNKIYELRKESHKEFLDGDEDDQRKKDEHNRPIKGTNLTIYSYHGEKAPNFKGFDPSVAAKRQNEIYIKIRDFRNSVQNARVLDMVKNYCGHEINTGPIGRKKRGDRSVLKDKDKEDEINDFGSDDGLDDNDVEECRVDCSDSDSDDAETGPHADNVTPL